MTPTAQTSEPRTEAGRRILRQDYRGNEAYTVTRQDILAIEAEAAALPAAPVGLDAERLNLAAYRTPKLAAESMKEWLYRVAAAYAATDPDAKEAHEVFNQHLDIEHLAALPAAPDPEADDAECGCGAIGIAKHTNAQHYGNALPADKPEPSVQAQPAGLDVERLTRVLWNSVDEARCWLDGEATSHNFASHIAAAYAEGEPTE